MNTKVSPIALVVLDGFGWSKETKYNAIAQAKKPTFDYLMAHYPHTLLHASGKYVGLPAGTAGNSEVGHMTLGAGRIIEQPITFLLQAIADDSFYKNPLLLQQLKNLAKSGNSLHIIGLLSDGNVHSNIQEAYAFIKAAADAGIKKIIVHAILDGRDVHPKSAADYLQQLQTFMKNYPQAILGSIIGRYYAMDRDENWDRTQEAYNNLVTEQKSEFSSWQQALTYYYKKNITDEFIPPTQLISDAIIKEHDGVIFFNVRPDRARQLINAFKLPLSFFITPFPLEENKKVISLYQEPEIKNTLKEVLSHHHKSLFCIAETEKYAHVTYFFSGGREAPFPGEQQTLIDSIKAQTYVHYPCMSAPKITQKVLESLQDPADFYLINYANADMVGHSGDLPATIKAIECLDEQIKQLYEKIVLELDGTLYITADHGNAELKWDEKEAQPHTAHTTSPVPFIWVCKQEKDKKIKLHVTELSDVAPFILKNMDISTIS